jgi:hypothetical protein
MSLTLHSIDVFKLLEILTHDLLNQMNVIDLNLQLMADDVGITRAATVSDTGSESGTESGALARAGTASVDLTDSLQLVDTWAREMRSTESSNRKKLELGLQLLLAHGRRFGVPGEELVRVPEPGSFTSCRIVSQQPGLFDPGRQSLPLYLLSYFTDESSFGTESEHSIAKLAFK